GRRYLRPWIDESAVVRPRQKPRAHRHPRGLRGAGGKTLLTEQGPDHRQTELQDLGVAREKTFGGPELPPESLMQDGPELSFLHHRLVEVPDEIRAAARGDPLDDRGLEDLHARELERPGLVRDDRPGRGPRGLPRGGEIARDLMRRLARPHGP